MNEKYAYEYKELMEFYPPNKITYNSIYKHLANISPFVGAGMSAFVYPMWQKLFSNIIQYMPNNEYKDNITKAIEDDDFFRAGDIVFECLQPPTFFSLIQEIFDVEKIHSDLLKKEAVYLIPQVFQGICFTTNFDKVLEKSYQECKKLYGVATPDDTKQISDSIKNNKTVIFKIHGDIDGKPDQIVLTGDSYKKHYSPKTALSKQLLLGMNCRRLIFLGASLKKDRTMEMLKKSIVPGIANYAIVGVQTSEQIDERNKELADLGISAIFYPINSNYGHSWVKKILEWLKYGFYAVSDDDVNMIIHKDRYYKYDCNYRQIPYIFPRDSYEELIKFLNTNDSFSWWEINGSGGCGKSRFVIEITEIAAKNNWNVRTFDANNFSDIYLDNNTMDDKTLYIFDDADFYNSSQITEKFQSSNISGLKFIKWLSFLVKKCTATNKLRIIFLFNSISLGSMVKNEYLWWRCLSESFNPMNINQFCKESFCINLDIENLITIMQEYAKLQYCSVLPKELLQTMFSWFENMDDDSLRIPLVSMLCVDAFFSDKSIDDFKKAVYQRIMEVEHLRIHATLMQNIEQYIKNIESIAESFYNHGHIKLEELQNNNAFTGDPLDIASNIRNNKFDSGTKTDDLEKQRKGE